MSSNGHRPGNTPEEIRYKQLHDELLTMMVAGELDHFDMLVELVDKRMVAAYNAGFEEGAREERMQRQEAAEEAEAAARTMYDKEE